jgi:hypothetical protein
MGFASEWDSRLGTIEVPKPRSGGHFTSMLDPKIRSIGYSMLPKSKTLLRIAHHLWHIYTRS